MAHHQTLGTIMWPFSSQKSADYGFREAVREFFAPLAVECGASLKQLEPLLFGFCTDYAVLTIGAYPGHFQSISVKLRRRVNREAVSVKDGVDLGLPVVEEFVSGKRSDIYRARTRWDSDQIREQVGGLSLIVRSTSLPYLNSPKADWNGLRAFIDAKIDKSWRERSDQKG